MFTLVSILIIIASLLLILIVLVQNSKGGGLAAGFTGQSTQMMGVRKTNDFLEKFTWTLAIVLLVLSIAASATIPRGMEAPKSVIQEQIESAPVMPNIPAGAAGAPVADPGTQE